MTWKNQTWLLYVHRLRGNSEASLNQELACWFLWQTARVTKFNKLLWRKADSPEHRERQLAWQRHQENWCSHISNHSLQKKEASSHAEKGILHCSWSWVWKLQNMCIKMFLSRMTCGRNKCAKILWAEGRTKALKNMANTDLCDDLALRPCLSAWRVEKTANFTLLPLPWIFMVV